MGARTATTAFLEASSARFAAVLSIDQPPELKPMIMVTTAPRLRLDAIPWRTSPPICPNLISDRHNFVATNEEGTVVGFAGMIPSWIMHRVWDFIWINVRKAVLAHQAIGMEPRVGAMLPCNVILREVEGGVEVSAIDPVASMAAIENDELKAVAAKVRNLLRSAVEAV
jgi:hypothetical protein